MDTIASEAAFERDVLAAEKLVLVDFYADWCGPCHALAPVLEKIAAARAGELKVVKVDIEQLGELTSRLGVSTIPTVILFEAGQERSRATGAMPRAALERQLGLV